MTLPRLRLRELLILVVYLALIGQAFVLGFVEPPPPELPSRYLPSDVPGYVWVPASEALDFLIDEQQKGQSGRKHLDSGEQFGLYARAVRMRPGGGESWMLLPVKLVK